MLSDYALMPGEIVRIGAQVWGIVAGYTSAGERRVVLHLCGSDTRVSQQMPYSTLQRIAEPVNDQ